MEKQVEGQTDGRVCKIGQCVLGYIVETVFQHVADLFFWDWDLLGFVGFGVVAVLQQVVAYVEFLDFLRWEMFGWAEFLDRNSEAEVLL